VRGFHPQRPWHGAPGAGWGHPRLSPKRFHRPSQPHRELLPRALPRPRPARRCRGHAAQHDSRAGQLGCSPEPGPQRGAAGGGACACGPACWALGLLCGLCGLCGQISRERQVTAVRHTLGRAASRPDHRPEKAGNKHARRHTQRSTTQQSLESQHRTQPERTTQSPPAPKLKSGSRHKTRKRTPTRPEPRRQSTPTALAGQPKHARQG
jgi:hypothetical protein